MMKPLIAIFTTLLLAFGAHAKQPLLSPAELSPKLGTPTLRILDIRDPKSYAENHIQGALNAPYGKWRGPKENPGELPSLAKLTDLVQSLGLSPQNHIVVVSSGADETDFGAAARVYWTLKVLGLEQLSILNGGVKAWNAAKLPLDKAIPTVSKSDYQPQINYALITSKDDLAKKSADGSAVLVDARPSAFFKGDTRHQAAKLPGTLKGAVNVEHSKWFDASSPTFTNPEAAKKIAANSNLNSDTEIVSFCNTGHWAATNWFAMSEILGKKNVSMYAGSMVDFTKDPNVPAMANVPNRGKQLWIDLKLWLERTFG
jgi:thiosulfate/3-mercaptopyruvate sulfurtransferase